MKKYLCVVTTIMFVMVFMAALFSSLPIAFAACGTCGSGGSSSGSSAQEGETPSTPPAERPHPHDQDLKDKPAGPPEGREEMNKNVKEEKDAQGNVTRTYTDSEGRVTRKEEIKQDGSKTITDYSPSNDPKLKDKERVTRKEERSQNGSKTVTDYNPDTGKPWSKLETHSSGHTKSDTRYDGKGNKISERTWGEDGSFTSHEIWHSDGSSQKFGKNNVIRESFQKTENGTRTDRFREDGSPESTTETKGMKVNVTEYDQTGKPTLERSIDQGMDTSKTIHNQDGSRTHFDYNLDGSVKSQTQTAAGGTSETKNYEAGKYFEADGVVTRIKDYETDTHNP